MGDSMQTRADEKHKPNSLLYSTVIILLAAWEGFWRRSQSLPHYKYIARPFYKVMGGDKKPLISVPLTFLLMDYLFHQLLSSIINDYRKDKLSVETFLTINILTSLMWLSFSIPVALHKYNKNQNTETNVDFDLDEYHQNPGSCNRLRLFCDDQSRRILSIKSNYAETNDEEKAFPGRSLSRAKSL